MRTAREADRSKCFGGVMFLCRPYRPEAYLYSDFPGLQAGSPDRKVSPQVNQG